jgi:uncharacterized protein
MLLIAGYVASLAMGIILGLMGGGGSILTIPILVFLIGMPVEQAPAHSLFVVGVASLVGTIRYLPMGKLSFSTSLIFGIPSMAGVYIAQYLIMPSIPQVLIHRDGFELTKGMAILLLFSVLLFLAGWTMVRRKNRQSPEPNDTEKKKTALAILGLLVGLFTGMVGAGGGFLIVPALLLLAKLPPKQAVGTSLLIISANSITGFIGAISAGMQLDWDLLLIFTLMAVLGILIGAGLSKIIPAGKLKVYFGWFTIAMGVFILSKTLWGVL